MSFILGSGTFTNGNVTVSGVTLTDGTLAWITSGTKLDVGQNPVEAVVEAIDAGTGTITLRDGWPLSTGSRPFTGTFTPEGIRDAVQSARGFESSLQSSIATIGTPSETATASTVAKRDSNARLESAAGVAGNDVLTWQNKTANSTDTTANLVTTVGWLGHGDETDPLTVTDLTTPPPYTGAYFKSTVGNPGNPTAGEAYWGEVLGFDGNNRTVIAFNNANDEYWQRYVGGVGQGWRKNWNDNNLPFTSDGSTYVSLPTAYEYRFGTARLFEGIVSDQDNDVGRYHSLHHLGVTNSNTSVFTGDLVVKLPAGSTSNSTMARLYLSISDGFGITSKIEVGGYAQNTPQWTQRYVRYLDGDGSNRVNSVEFGVDGTQHAVILSTDGGDWSSYTAVELERVDIQWQGGADADMQDPSGYEIELTATPPTLTSTDTMASSDDRWQEVWTTGNLNPNEWGVGATGDIISKGVARSTTLVLFDFELMAVSAPSGFTMDSTFRILDSNLAEIAAGLTVSSFSLASSSGNRKMILQASTTGLTPDANYYLVTQTTDSKVIANF